MSIMGNVAGLGAVQPDWAQTDEKRADFIRNKPDMAGMEEDMQELRDLAEKALPKAGGTMTGGIDMGFHRITRLSANPQDAAEAVRKDYVDGKHKSGTVTLTTAGWSGGAQTIDVSGILATDMPHWGVVYGTNREAEREAFALVDALETADGKFTFRCFDGVPAVALTVQWEVNR